MSRLLCIVFLFFLANHTKAQLINADLFKLRHQWGYFDFARANTARFSMYMFRAQKRTMLYMNLARQNGKKFTELVVDPYMDRLDKRIERKEDRISELEHKRNGFNLRVFFKEIRVNLMENKRKEFPISLPNNDLDMLYPSFRLWLSAAPHALYSGLFCMTGHQLFELRMGMFLHTDITGENCSYGYVKGLDVTLQLLNSSGHRRNIMEEDFSRAAVSKLPHICTGVNSVTTFSGPKFSDITLRDHCDFKHIQANVSFLTDFERPIIDMSIGQRKNKNVMSARWAAGVELYPFEEVNLYAPKLHWASEFYNVSMGCNFVNYLFDNSWTPVLRPEFSYRFPFTKKRGSLRWNDLEQSRSSIGVSYGYNYNIDKERNMPVGKHIVAITYSHNFLFYDKKRNRFKKIR